jgi:cytochrome P450
MTKERAAPILNKHYPIGSSVRLEDLYLDPYPILARLRKLEPVSWIPEFKMWFVTRFDDVEAVLHDVETFTLEDDESLLNEIFGRTMISTDGPEHTRLRKPFHPPFLPKFVRSKMSATIEARAHALIDSFVDAGEVDLAAAWADRLALEVVMLILGLPIHDHALVRGWFSEIGLALANIKRDEEVRKIGQNAARAFTDFARIHLERLRENPDNSILGNLARNETDLTDTEILEACRVIIFGGLETTAALLLNTTWALLNRPRDFKRVLEQPELLGNAIEETLRWEPPVQTLTRRATRDTEIRGVNISAGETLNCMIGAANRDPEKFEHPNEFMLERANAKNHLSFAIGRHFCLGAALARLEAEIGLRVLYERLPGLRLDPDRPCEPRGHEFRSPPALWIRWERK